MPFCHLFAVGVVLCWLAAWLPVVSNRHYVGDLLDQPRHQALPALQGLVKALADKQEVAFSGGATIMKIVVAKVDIGSHI